MRITRVTITGADDGAPPVSIAHLSSKYPFVEWGVLRSEKRSGGPRYPSPNWLAEISAMAGNPWAHSMSPPYGPVPPKIHLSNHLCGKLSRWVMAGSMECAVEMRLLRARRMQLNGFSDYVLPALLVADRFSDEFILQCGSQAAIQHAAHLHEQSRHASISALWDLSGGRGTTFALDELPEPSTPRMRIGYAGGISEQNIEAVCRRLQHLGDSRETWVNLESGARTDDRFDLDKVERILQLAAPFISKSE